jgi:hypothetical protein
MHGVGRPAFTFKAVAGSEEPALAEIGFSKAASGITNRDTDFFANEPDAVTSKLFGIDPEPMEIVRTAGNQLDRLPFRA